MSSRAYNPAGLINTALNQARINARYARAKQRREKASKTLREANEIIERWPEDEEYIEEIIKKKRMERRPGEGSIKTRKNVYNKTRWM